MIDLSFSANELQYFLLVLTRITCFVFIAPFFSMNNVPRRFRVAISIFIAFLVYQVTFPHEMPEAPTVLMVAILIMKEAITGLLTGFAANICISIVNFAGHVADMEMGLSMASMVDPVTRENTSVSGIIYQNAFMLILIVSGFYRYLLKAIVETFELIPVGQATFHLDMLNTTLVGFLGTYLLIGFRIALPIVAAAMLLNAILGIMAKVAPQMHMFAIGMQLKVLLGFFILFATVGMLPTISDFIFTEIKVMVKSVVEGMM